MHPKRTMKAKNDVAVYVIRDVLDAQTKSKELTERCLKHHFGRSVQILRKENGKPCFSDPSLGTFNLSHSADIFVLAVFCGGEVGIDVECPQENKNYSRLIRKYCAECERKEDFFRVWTAKEACCKLTGEGLSGMGRVKISFSPYRADVQGCGCLYLYDLSVAVGAPCTLATDKEVTWKVNDL